MFLTWEILRWMLTIFPYLLIPETFHLLLICRSYGSALGFDPCLNWCSEQTDLAGPEIISSKLLEGNWNAILCHLREQARSHRPPDQKDWNMSHHKAINLSKGKDWMIYQTDICRRTSENGAMIRGASLTKLYRPVLHGIFCQRDRDGRFFKVWPTAARFPRILSFSIQKVMPCVYLRWFKILRSILFENVQDSDRLSKT
jgi:hypothetical protein